MAANMRVKPTIGLAAKWLLLLLLSKIKTIQALNKVLNNNLIISKVIYLLIWLYITDMCNYASVLNKHQLKKYILLTFKIAHYFEETKVYMKQILIFICGPRII